MKNHDFIHAYLMVNGDRLTADSFVWKEGMPGWKQVKNVPEIYKYIILKNARK